MNPSPCVIQLDGITKHYGKRTILDHVSMDIPRSAICGLLGPSGAGKTTLVKLIAGIELADSGTVTVQGIPMPNLGMLMRIGYMAQSDALYMELSAKENLEFFGRLYGLKGKALRSRIDHVMALVNLTEHLRKPVHLYSGGMKRRLSLAASLLHKPEVLILDEPTVGIDPVLRLSVWQELEALSRNGTTILVTTHVMDEAARCHTLGLLRDGSILAYGTPEQLMLDTETNSIEGAFLYYGGVRA